MGKRFSILIYIKMKAPENGLKNEKKISAVKKMLKKYGFEAYHFNFIC